MAVIEVNQLDYRYGKRLALDDVNFSVKDGELFGVLGPNGGGKSTLFKILSTLLSPQKKCVYVFGTDVVGAPSAIRRDIGVVFQTPAVDDKLTLLENLVYQGHFYGIEGSSLASRAQELLNLVGLWERRGDFAQTLSGGLKRRLDIARAILHQPKLLLMDEPTVGLDPGARREIWRYLGVLKEKLKMTVLFTTHLLEEATHCHQVVLLDKGKVVEMGEPTELIAGIGGQVLTVRSSELSQIDGLLKSTFNLQPELFDNELRVRGSAMSDVALKLFDSFSIDSMTIGQPTLEDFFLEKTGNRFSSSENEGVTS